MEKLIGSSRNDETDECSAGFFVRGAEYGNTAARFWMALLDEVSVDFPECVEMELSAPTSTPLVPEQLYPDLEFQAVMKRLEDTDFREGIRGILAEMELFGPPAPVMIHLRQENCEILSKGLPTDYVDAEIFPYLVVWLLEWARISAETWNNEYISGSFDVTDKRGQLAHDIEFSVTTDHLSEGLYRKSVAMRMAPPVNAG